MKRIYALAISALSVLGLIATLASPAAAWGSREETGKADKETSRQLEQLISQANAVVGMPSIVNFFEKRMARMIYEKRDDPTYRTFAYWTTMNGEYVFICDSIGYGINSSVQFSNPMKRDRGYYTREADYADDMQMPQPEPNALWMPEGLAATYVLCIDPNSKQKEPEIQLVYAEQNIMVLPFEIPNAINPYNK